MIMSPYKQVEVRVIFNLELKVFDTNLLYFTFSIDIIRTIIVKKKENAYASF